MNFTFPKYRETKLGNYSLYMDKKNEYSYVKKELIDNLKENKLDNQVLEDLKRIIEEVSLKNSREENLQEIIEEYENAVQDYNLEVCLTKLENVKYRMDNIESIYSMDSNNNLIGPPLDTSNYLEDQDYWRKVIVYKKKVIEEIEYTNKLIEEEETRFRDAKEELAYINDE
jgi:hypothetical protein